MRRQYRRPPRPHVCTFALLALRAQYSEKTSAGRVRCGPPRAAILSAVDPYPHLFSLGIDRHHAVDPASSVLKMTHFRLVTPSVALRQVSSIFFRRKVSRGPCPETCCGWLARSVYNYTGQPCIVMRFLYHRALTEVYVRAWLGLVT